MEPSTQTTPLPPGHCMDEVTARFELEGWLTRLGVLVPTALPAPLEGGEELGKVDGARAILAHQYATLSPAIVKQLCEGNIRIAAEELTFSARYVSGATVTRRDLFFGIPQGSFLLGFDKGGETPNARFLSAATRWAKKVDTAKGGALVFVPMADMESLHASDAGVVVALASLFLILSD